jgi:hypothetical protein
MGPLLIAALASPASVPVISVCEAVQELRDGRQVLRVEGELRNSIEFANYLKDPKCPEALILIDIPTADRSYIDRPGKRLSDRGSRVLLEGQLVTRSPRQGIGWMYRVKLIRVTRKAKPDA